MINHRSIMMLASILALLTLVVGGVATYLTYRTAFAQQTLRLQETAQSRARLMEAMVRFDQARGQDAFAEGMSAMLTQIREAHAHFTGFGDTGEFVLGMRQGERIVFLLRHRHDDLDNPRPVAFDSAIAEPMRRALNGRSGTLVGLDYRGEPVLAAHEPVAISGLGVVAKIDLVEIRRPFQRTFVLVMLIGTLLAAIGAALFFHVTGRWVAALHRAEARYHGIFGQAAVGIARLDRDGTWLEVNDRLCDIVGYPQQELLSKRFQDIACPKDREHDRQLLQQAISGRLDNFRLEQCYLGKSGDRVWASVTISVVRDVHGSPDFLVAVMQDISERKRMETELRHLATHDGLTGVLNRKAFEQRIAAEIARAGRYHHPVSVLMLDIDHFKAVNDRYGHAAGDAVLRGLVIFLQAAIRENDSLGRYGGEEFVAVLPETGLDEALNLANRLRADIAANPIAVGEDDQVSITASIGVATWPMHGGHWESLVNAADVAMYGAKQAGRNRVQAAELPVEA